MTNNETYIKILQGKLENLRTRCHESARDAFDNGNYCALHIVTVGELKNDDKIKELKYELEKTYNQLMQTEKEAQEKIAKLEKTRGNWADRAVEWKEKCEESDKKIKELESELEVKDNLLKIKNGLCGSFDCLPSEPISVVNMLINAKEEYEPTSLEKALFSDTKPLIDKYSDDDLEQIAEHLLVYCKHHRDGQD